MKDNGSMNARCNLPYYFSVSITFYPVPRIPTKRFLAPTQVYELPTEQSKQGLPPLNFYRCSFYMHLILHLRPPLNVISLQDQPLISPNSNHNIEPAILQLLAQQKKKKPATNYPASSSLTTKNWLHSACQPLLSPSNPISYPCPTSYSSRLSCIHRSRLAIHFQPQPCFT